MKICKANFFFHYRIPAGRDAALPLFAWLDDLLAAELAGMATQLSVAIAVLAGESASTDALGSADRDQSMRCAP